MEGDVFVRPKRGTPQGGVISPLMANIALHGIEMDTKNALKRDLFQHLKRGIIEKIWDALSLCFG